MKRRRSMSIAKRGATARKPPGRSGIRARLAAAALQLKEDQRLDRHCRVKKGTLKIHDVAALLIQEQLQDIGSLTIDPGV